MTLFWLLCVCLVLGGLVVHREVRAALADLWLSWFGICVRVRSERVPRRRTAAPPPRHDPLPPFRVETRPGP